MKTGYWVAGIVAGAVVAPVFGRDVARVAADKETVIEAVAYTTTRTRDDHAWKKIKSQRKDMPDCIWAGPANNKVYDLNKANFEKTSPSAVYELNFDKPGTYYVWINGLGGSGDASVAVGFDGALIKSVLVGFFPPKYTWLGVFNNGERIRVDVQKTGVHTLGLWMVEDGVRISKILITPDAAFKGPPPALLKR